jgi:hypothetical protein
MTRTREQMQAAAKLRNLLEAAGVNLQVCLDDERWPIAPGTYGRLEWLGTESDQSERIYVYSDRRNVIPRLRAVPRVQPCQTGEDEVRLWVQATDHPTLHTVARLIRA